MWRDVPKSGRSRGRLNASAGDVSLLQRRAVRRAEHMIALTATVLALLGFEASEQHVHHRWHIGTVRRLARVFTATSFDGLPFLGRESWLRTVISA